MPTDPPPSRWTFPPVTGADPDGPVALGADLEPGTLLEAYRKGLFPMPVGRRGAIGWFSPDPRAVLPLDAMLVSRSLRRSTQRLVVTVDESFEDVIRSCADPTRPHGWITEDFVHAYTRLHELGWAHSVETWCEGQLVGGLYGVAIGSFFAGESMFHKVTDASKVALVHLVDVMGRSPYALLDVQWATAHLRSLGATELSRDTYMKTLRVAVSQPPLAIW